MDTPNIDEAKLREVVKEAVLEVLDERRDWLAELLSETLLDAGLGYAIQEGEQSVNVTREQVFELLNTDA